MGFRYSISETVDSVFNVVSELLSFGKRQKDMKVDAYLIYPNGDLTRCRALITESEEWVYVPIVSRFWYVTQIHKLGRKRAVFLPYKYHKTLDLSKNLNPLQVKAIASLEYMRRWNKIKLNVVDTTCLLYTSPSPRDRQRSRMPSSA